MTLIVILICSAIVFFFSSCGTTRAIVRNGTDSAVTSITITTNNPIDVNTSPDVHTTLNQK